MLSRQLPTYDGTKSYQNLLVGVYGMQTVWNWNDTRLDSATQFLPLNFTRSGYYRNESGTVSGATEQGDYAQAKSTSKDNIGYLYFNKSYLAAQAADVKGDGYTLRCLVR